jgi:hypothetical protein
MIPTNLAIYSENSGWVVDAPGIRLDDFEVCRLLHPFFYAAYRTIETADLLVGRIEIRPDCIRAYTRIEANDKERSDEWPSFCQKDLPPGLYEALLDLSRGPHHPFPKPVLDPAFCARQGDFLNRLQRVAFPLPKHVLDPSDPGLSPAAIVLKAENFSDLLKYLPSRSGRLDPCTELASLKKGFMGILYEHLEPETNVGGRKVQVWVHKEVPEGHVALLYHAVPLDQHPIWTEEVPCFPLVNTLHAWDGSKPAI